MIILKEEINQLASQNFDLAKWKLIVVGSFAVVGSGWGNIKPGDTTGLFLLNAVGFLCLYIDSLCYRRATAIHVLAKYLRDYEGSDVDTKELRSYEKHVRTLNNNRAFFISDTWPQFFASFIFTVGLSLMGAIRYESIKPPCEWYFAFPIVSIVLSIVLLWTYRKNRNKLVFE